MYMFFHGTHEHADPITTKPDFIAHVRTSVPYLQNASLSSYLFPFCDGHRIEVDMLRDINMSEVVDTQFDVEIPLHDLSDPIR
jgi:hypothetical protein